MLLEEIAKSIVYGNKGVGAYNTLKGIGKNISGNLQSYYRRKEKELKPMITSNKKHYQKKMAAQQTQKAQSPIKPPKPIQPKVK